MRINRKSDSIGTWKIGKSKMKKKRKSVHCAKHYVLRGQGRKTPLKGLTVNEKSFLKPGMDAGSCSLMTPVDWRCLWASWVALGDTMY